METILLSAIYSFLFDAHSHVIYVVDYYTNRFANMHDYFLTTTKILIVIVYLACTYCSALVCIVETFSVQKEWCTFDLQEGLCNCWWCSV